MALDEKFAKNPVAVFGDLLLRGSGQVMFQNHPLTGLLFLVGVFWGAVVSGTPAVALGAVWGLVLSTLTAMWLRVDKASLKQGLYGYNGILVGAALPTFLSEGLQLWLLVSLGAIGSTIAFMAIANIFKTWDGPALTFPFVLVSWTLLLATYAFANVPIGSLAPPQMASHVTAAGTSLVGTPNFWLESTACGISQVFLIANPVTGLLFVVALAVSSRWAAALAVVSSLLAVGTAVLFGADSVSVQNGLFGFSPVLTGIALGCVFYKPSRRVLAFTFLGIISTVMVQAALDVMMMPFGVVALTAPFVFTTWIFLLAKGDLAPVPHRERGTEL